MLKEENTLGRVSYSRNEFCRIHGISLSTLQREIRAGRIRVFKAGRRTLIPASEVHAWPSRLQESDVGAQAV